ncbi:hypothetical protein Pcinc_006139 [Petrolisthes cinctipes]|uniref:Uncharacterized protein n=1 Tax=Petrolisthes cinctipes TaxID=88211 RepID=A0AAE1GDL4_PETCI|nr:hypothetical protein Pcinc_006139 [Petrolisthes cinctipes]
MYPDHTCTTRATVTPCLTSDTTQGARTSGRKTQANPGPLRVHLQFDRVTDASLQAVLDHNMSQVAEALAQTKPTVHPSPPGHPQVDFDYSSGVALLVSKICQMADMVGSKVWSVRVADGRRGVPAFTLTLHRLYLSALHSHPIDSTCQYRGKETHRVTHTFSLKWGPSNLYTHMLEVESRGMPGEMTIKTIMVVEGQHSRVLSGNLYTHSQQQQV